MRYKDKRGWLFEVRSGTYGWTIYCNNPEKERWWPWPCAGWYEKMKNAEWTLKRFAKLRGWEEQESDSSAQSAV